MATTTTLINFTGTNGKFPAGELLIDAQGDLFGTTSQGGPSGVGNVFEVVDNSGVYATSPTTIVNFNVATGQNPQAGLIADANGNLIGTTSNDKSGNNGTVFEISKSGGGFSNTPTTVVTFNGTDGAFPVAGVINTVDAAGDLFGMTSRGGTGTGASGTVFEIADNAGVYASSPTTLATFTASTGTDLVGGVVADAAGDLFGIAETGGSHSVGTIWELIKTGGAYVSTPTVLFNFDGTNGSFPEAGLIIDAAGNLFGTTENGGSSSQGTVFELPLVSGSYASAPTVLVNFNGTDGAHPQAKLLMDHAGNLFGTTFDGGPDTDSLGGTVFEVVKSGGGYLSTPVVVAASSATDTNIFNPSGGLTVDAAGDLFGMSGQGGTSFEGNIFEITNTGFVTCFRRGTRIATRSGERPVEALVTGDEVLLASGQAERVTWVGHRRVDCRKHPQPEEVWPVRVRIGAFADDTPHRDLFLSPNHAVFVDDVLIPIRYLINGESIAQIPVDEVFYYHVELPRHDVLLAEGLPTESYLDVGDRANFTNGGGLTALHPVFVPGIWEAMGHSKLVVSGSLLALVRRRVNARASMISKARSVAAA